MCKGKFTHVISSGAIDLSRITIALAFIVCVFLPIGNVNAQTNTYSDGAKLFGIGFSINDSLVSLDKIASLNANSARIDAPWSQIEITSGVYVIPKWLDNKVDGLLDRGIQPLLILAYGNKLYEHADKPTTDEGLEAFSKYAAFVVNYFKGRVFYYDIWNEWDAHTARTTPMGAIPYIKLLRKTYPAVKSIDARVQFLSGGISDKGIREGFFIDFFRAGGGEYVDGISVHPYVWNSRTRRTPEAAFMLVDEIYKISKKFHPDRNLPFYITEIGWPSHEGKYGLSDAAVRSYIDRYFLLGSSREYIKGMFWYCLRDQGDDVKNKEHRFGLFSSDFQRKATADGFADIVGKLIGAKAVVIRHDSSKYVAEITFKSERLGTYTWSDVDYVDGHDADSVYAPIWLLR